MLVYINSPVMLGDYLQQTTLSDAFFLGGLRVNINLPSTYKTCLDCSFGNQIRILIKDCTVFKLTESTDLNQSFGAKVHDPRKKLLSHIHHMSINQEKGISKRSESRSTPRLPKIQSYIDVA